MPEASLITRNPTAPASYDQLFREQFPRLVRRLGRLGWDTHTAQDLAMAVIIRVIERNGLEGFDVSRAKVRDGEVSHVRFNNYFDAFAYWQLRGLMTAEQLRAHRFPLIPNLDEHILGLVPDTAEVVTDQMEATEMLAQILDHLRRRPRRRGAHDRSAVLKQMLTQIFAQGWVNPEILGRHFGVTTPTARQWIRDMYDDIARMHANLPSPAGDNDDLFNPDGSGPILSTTRPGSD